MFKKLSFLKKILLVNAFLLAIAGTAVSFVWWSGNTVAPDEVSDDLDYTIGEIPIETALTVIITADSTNGELVPKDIAENTDFEDLDFTNVLLFDIELNWTNDIGINEGDFISTGTVTFAIWGGVDGDVNLSTYFTLALANNQIVLGTKLETTLTVTLIANAGGIDQTIFNAINGGLSVEFGVTLNS